jgi:hypothetical protein
MRNLRNNIIGAHSKDIEIDNESKGETLIRNGTRISFTQIIPQEYLGGNPQRSKSYLILFSELIILIKEGIQKKRK